MYNVLSETRMRKGILGLFWITSITMFHKTAFSEDVCACEQVNVITAGSDPTYRHHSIPLPKLKDLESLTQETQNIIRQIKCAPTSYLAGPGEAFFLCPPAFVPCPPLFATAAKSPEIYKGSTARNSAELYSSPPSLDAPWRTVHR